MARLEAWSIDEQHGEGGSHQSKPQRVRRSQIELERHLEDWIVNDMTMIGEGITLVGRQISIDDGRLDLLAIDSQDRWVVIEVKPGMLDSGALHQAIYYTSSLARLDKDELFGKLEAELDNLGDAVMLSRKVKQQLANEKEEREIALLLVGTGTNSGLERVNEFLGRYNVPISIVSFEVFELQGGPKLLIREVFDEQTVSPPRPGRYSVEAIHSMAIHLGVGNQLDRFVKMSERAGLRVQPQKKSVRIAPPTNRTRFLMYAGPQEGASGGELEIWLGPKAFAELFPHINEEEVTAALGKYEDGGTLAGEELNERLDQIENFLQKHFPKPETHDV